MTPNRSTAPKAYGYIRCSHESSKLSGLGMEVQEQQIRAYITFLQSLDEHKGLEYGGIFKDEAVSAFKYNFTSRKYGGLLNAAVRPGDQIVFARFDRPFRNLGDAIATTDNWMGRKIGVHFVIERIDLTTPHGRFLFQSLGAVAELQSRILSARNKEIAARGREKKNKRLGGPSPPAGFKCVGAAGRREFVDNPADRAVMQEIVRLRDEEKLTWRQIGDRIEARLAEFEGRKPHYGGFGKREWEETRIRRAYERELDLQAAAMQALSESIANGTYPAPDETIQAIQEMLQKQLATTESNPRSLTDDRDSEAED